MENVAAAIALAVTEARAAGRVYNLGEPDALTTEAWVRAIGRAAGWSGEIVALPSTDLPVHLRADLDLRQDLISDTTRVRRELGYAEPLARDEALQRTVAWERARPPEEIDPAAFDYAAEDAALARIG